MKSFKTIAPEGTKRTTQGVRLAQRAREGQLVWDEELGAELCERFLTLDETDQEAFWANVKIEAEQENWMAGGPEPADQKRKPRRPPIMSPPIPGAVLTLEQALQRLQRVRVKGDEWRSLCPAHENRSRLSLIISESSSRPGEPVFYCYAGCTHHTIKAKLMGGE